MAIAASTFVDAARRVGCGLYTGVPCSYLKPLINHTIDDANLTYVGAANEGDAVAIASGSFIGGVPAIAMFQNSGLGNAVSPLSSLNAIFQIPVLLIVTLRGEPNGPHDEPQHALMGKITTELLELLEIPWEYFPADEGAVGEALGRAGAHMERTRTPYAFVMKKGAVRDAELRTRPAPFVLGAPLEHHRWSDSRPSRRDVLASILRVTQRRDALVATTGYTGRELYALADLPNHFYMVGSMGCASSFGLGLALARPRHRVVVIDGDGAALMRLSALTTLGAERPRNLVHIVLDNEMHESTGGQGTASASTDLAAIARASGYEVVLRADSLDAIESTLRTATDAVTFVHVKVAPGTASDLPRPSVSPIDVATRFRKWLDASP